MTKLLATDLDGTLLNVDGAVSNRTVRAVGDLRVAGWKIAVVTGRPPRWLAPVAVRIGWSGFAVAANGAVVVDLEKRVVERTFPISGSSLRHTVATIRGMVPGAAFAVELVAPGTAVPDAPGGIPQQWVRLADEPAAFACEPSFRPSYRIPAGTPIGRIEELMRVGNVVKLLARAPVSHNADRMLAVLASELRDVVTVTHSSPHAVLLEISAHGVSKASGLAYVADRHAVGRAAVVAVGDMPNDLPMLGWAGQAWAMGNAHPAVRALVGPDRVLPPNSEDGVADLIGRLLNGSADMRSSAANRISEHPTRFSSASSR